MNLQDYQNKALATAKPEAFSYDYLLPGIIGEVGELFGQRAKAHWHGLTTEELNKHLAKEFGDICWMTAVLLSPYQISEVVEVPEHFFSDAGTGELMLALLQASVDFQRLHTGEEPGYKVGNDLLSIRDTAVSFWQLLHGSCQKVTGHSFETVLQMNLEKLASRAARGTLVGRGDDR